MEVTVVHVEHVPKGYLLSLNAGGSRRQAPVVAGQRFKFSAASAASALAEGGTGLQMDVLAVEGSARVDAQEITAEPAAGAEGETNLGSVASRDCADVCRDIEVPVPPSPKAGGAGSTNSEDPLNEMRVVLDIKCTNSGKTSTMRAVLKGPNASEAPLDIAAPPEKKHTARSSSPAAPSPAADGTTSSSAAAPLAAEGSLTRPPQVSGAAAASYLHEHNIMPFIESMVRILAKDRPADPWKHISAMLPEDLGPQEREAIKAAIGQANAEAQVESKQGDASFDL